MRVSLSTQLRHAPLQVGACLGEAELRKGGEEVGRPNLPYISPISPLHLAYISYTFPTSRYISPTCGNAGRKLGSDETPGQM